MDIKITLRKDKKNKNNEYPIVIQLSEKKEVARISLGISAKIEDFDFKNQKLKRTNKQTAPVNDFIDQTKKIIELAEHHYKDMMLHPRAQIKAGSEIEMFKKLYEKIKIGKEKDENHGIDLVHGNTDIEFVKDGLVYEYDTRKREPIRLRLSPNITPDNLTKIKRIANAIINNQEDEETNVWLSKKDTNIEYVPVDVKTFKKRMQEYLDHSKFEKKDSTHSRLKGHFNTLEAFAKHSNIILTFDSFDEQFGLDFKYYLEKSHKNKAHKRTGVSVGTVHNIQKNISAFLNWAHKKNYHQNLNFKKWKTFKPKTDLQYLTEDQLVKLREHELPDNSSYSRSRDLWLFMAYTGMRVSDMKKFKQSNINNDNVIKFVSQKANKLCTVPLTTVTGQILSKYDYVLPVQAESKILSNIKEILRAMGLTNVIGRTIQYGKKNEVIEMPLCEAINNHSARRSFINLMITKGVEVFQLSSMTGNTVQNLMIYYKTNEKQLVDSISKLDLK